mgnify:CR=1 FL=1
MPLYIAMFFEDSRLFNIAKKFEAYGYRAVEPSRQHLTLLFVGDPDSVHEHRIVEELRCLRLDPPLVLELEGMGLLPQHKLTNVVVFVKPDTRLFKLRRVLEEHVSKHFTLSDRYPFSPHITIARRPRAPPSEVVPSVEECLRKTERELPRTVMVKKISVVRSWRGVYRSLLDLFSLVSSPQL